MNPLSMVRPPVAAAPTPAAPADNVAPGFAALLVAACEPVAPAAPDAAGDADEGAPATPEAANEPEARNRKALRKPHATVHKKPVEGADAAPPIAADMLAALRAQTRSTEGSGEPAAAQTGADERPSAPADAMALPLTAPSAPPPAPPIEGGAEPTTTGAMPVPHAGPARETARAAPPDAEILPAAPAAIDNADTPRAEPAPLATASPEAPRRAPAPNPTDNAPGAMPIAAAPAGASAPSTTPVAAPFTAQLAAALESPAFAPALATQVRWLVDGGVQHAQLTLNPAEMGPVAVRIAVEGTQARIDFMADLAPTRAALEGSLPTLAAALAEGGLTLAGGGVFDGSSARQPPPDAQGQPRPRHAGAAAGSAEVAPRAPHGPLRARGLVDLVA
jgi:hypothetical protein